MVRPSAVAVNELGSRERAPGQAVLGWRSVQGIADTRVSRRLGWLTALVGMGYFFVWTMLGVV